MILVLKKDVIDKIADDLYHQDCTTYEPLWRIDSTESWRLDRKDPRKAVVDMIKLINKHNREGT